MRNPLINFLHAWKTWAALKRYPGLLAPRDALLQFHRVVLPQRFTYRRAGKQLARLARINEGKDGFWEIRLPAQDLVFYWAGAMDNNLFYVLDQEINPGNPHHYTTPPIRLQADSLALDVGACEGLFAFRAVRQKLARRVICFEPSTQVAEGLARGARVNQVDSAITLERVAVGRRSGSATFDTGIDALSGRLTAEAPMPGQSVIPVRALDEYCAEKQLKLTAKDLLKIDAEGADLDVLQGAENLIRTGTPQIAVTTYHTEQHVYEIVDWLQRLHPAYRMRLKGFSFWTPTPRPVMLLASTLAGG